MARKLSDLSRVLRELANVPSQVSKSFAAYATKQIKAGFRAGVDPYGSPWKPNAPSTIRKKGHGRPNIDTGAMMVSAKAVPLPGAGVTFRVGPGYATFAQRVRPFFPNAGMPPAWREALRELVREQIRKTLKG
jgi:hypothetical protein